MVSLSQGEVMTPGLIGNVGDVSGPPFHWLLQIKVKCQHKKKPLWGIFNYWGVSLDNF